ncbi:Uncharacterised protein [BD1-7 clade bacterium]|uniref:Uncharacterized protein n=1 Tax=BD1-7 clade bacterium TaxID=2029982 RepID=A0A5S9PQZ1_9GAMM|nr:Uncharacterised protein [BD1-7 clade bacterium]
MFSIKEVAKLNQAIKIIDGYEDGLRVVGIPIGEGPYTGYDLIDINGESVYNPGLLSAAAKKVSDAT